MVETRRGRIHQMASGRGHGWSMTAWTRRRCQRSTRRRVGELLFDACPGLPVLFYACPGLPFGYLMPVLVRLPGSPAV
jgi:hypothetical protein